MAFRDFKSVRDGEASSSLSLGQLMNSDTDLEHQLRVANERLKNAAAALASKHTGGGLEEYKSADAEVLRLERALAALDLTEFWLPDGLTAALAMTGVATAWLGIAPALQDRLIGGVAGFGALWAIGAAYKAYRGHEGLGGGDPKLLGAIGLWIGWRLLPVLVVIASLIGLGVALFWLVTGRAVARDDRLPFGALLAIAAYPTEIAMLLWGG